MTPNPIEEIHMRIWSVTPIHVSPEELARRQERYDRISPPGLTVHLHDIGPDAPRALETSADIRASERCVVDALSAVPAGYDAVMPDCVLDPGVAELQERGGLPVIGILRVNLAHAHALATPTAAVVRNQAIAEEMRAVATAYGWGDALTDVGTVELDVAAIAEGDRWQEELEQVAADLSARGATRLLNGCSAVETLSSERLPLRVFDPVARALRLVQAGA
jgi:allantoin racemase